jgi:hypothetical protein
MNAVSVDCGSPIVTSCNDGAAGFNRPLSQVIQQSELRRFICSKQLRVGHPGLESRFPVLRKPAGDAFSLIQVCKILRHLLDALRRAEAPPRVCARRQRRPPDYA